MTNVSERISDERLAEMLAAWEQDERRARKGHGMNMQEMEIVSALRELQSLRSASTPAKAVRVTDDRDLEVLEPQQEEAVAWQPSAEAVRVVAKRLAEHLTGKKPPADIEAKAAVFLWNCIVEGALSPLYAHPIPAQKMQESQIVSALEDAPQQEVVAIDRDHLGRLVREAWVKWAKTRPNPKPSWLAPYDDLSEPDKEADRQIGEALFLYGHLHPPATGSEHD